MQSPSVYRCNCYMCVLSMHSKCAAILDKKFRNEACRIFARGGLYNKSKFCVSYN